MTIQISKYESENGRLDVTMFDEEDHISHDEGYEFLKDLPFYDSIMTLDMPYGFDNE